MTRTKNMPKGQDALENRIEAAFQPGRFISDQAGGSFVRGLEDVEKEIERLIGREAPQALRLYETFLAGCHEKAEEVDDSSGGFGDFVQGLFCAWIRARQASGANSEETAARLLAWMDEDPYGFCHDIERRAAEALDPIGLMALRRQIKDRLNQAAESGTVSGDAKPRAFDYARRRWTEAFKVICQHQRDVQGYLELSGVAGGLTSKDCIALAKMLLAQDKPQDALLWVERGFHPDAKDPSEWMAAHDLARLKREILMKLGRGREALDAAWAEYQEHPNRFSYDEFMRFAPEAERSTWHTKAMEAADRGDLGSRISLFLETDEIGRLIECVRESSDRELEALSHFVTEPAAEKLATTHPDVAARLWRAQGLRILRAKKSKYYAAALSNLREAMRCYDRAGLAGEWLRVVEEIRSDHSRKVGFRSSFEEMLANSGAGETPSFLERAKGRWGFGRPEGP